MYSNRMKDFLCHVNRETIARFGQIWVCLGLVLIPFIRYSSSARFPEADRAASIVIWTLGMVLICMLDFYYQRKSFGFAGDKSDITSPSTILKKSVAFPLIALIVWVLLSSSLNGMSEEMMIGSPLRGDGLLLWLSFILSACCSAYLIRSHQREKLQHTFAFGWVGVALLSIIIFCLSPLLTPAVEFMTARWLGTDLYIVSILLFGAIWFGYFTSRYYRAVSQLMIGFVLIILWRTDIILPFLLALFMLPLSLFASGEYKISFIQHKYLVICSVMCGSLFILLTAGWWMHLHSDDLFENFSSHEGRYTIYSRFWNASTHRPALGWGWSEMENAYLSEVPEGDRKAVAIADKSHSLWFDWLIATGWPGLLLFILLVGGVSTELWQRGSWLCHTNERTIIWYRLAFLGMVTYLVLASVNVVSVYVEWGWWLLVGLVLFRSRITNQPILEKQLPR